ncbi:MAG: hypothetical protein HC828_00615 [Blastochloris sp.]|nr:hypothetical protein [Blastochloris sp.]
MPSTAPIAAVAAHGGGDDVRSICTPGAADDFDRVSRRRQDHVAQHYEGLIVDQISAADIVVLSDPWGETPPQTQLVFLSPPGELDTAALAAALDGCRVERSEEQVVAAQQTWMRGAPA